MALWRKPPPHARSAISAPAGLPPPQVRIPVPGVSEAVGLGDVVAKVTKAVGIKPCVPCAKRRARLNRLIQFGGRRKEPEPGGES